MNLTTTFEFEITTFRYECTMHKHISLVFFAFKPIRIIFIYPNCNQLFYFIVVKWNEKDTGYIIITIKLRKKLLSLTGFTSYTFDAVIIIIYVVGGIDQRHIKLQCTLLNHLKSCI